MEPRYIALLAAAFLTASPRLASAEVPATHVEIPQARWPAAQAQRSLAIGKANLALGAGLGYFHSPLTGGFTANLPTRIGVLDNLEIFMVPTLRPATPRLHDPDIGVLYQLNKRGSQVEIGARASSDLAILGPKPHHVALRAGVPLRFHAAPSFTAEIGAYGVVTVVPSTYGGFFAPLALTFNAHQQVALSAGGGLAASRFSDFSGTRQLPVWASIDFTIPSGVNALLDVGPRVEWADIQNEKIFSLLLVGKLYLYL